MHNGAEVTAREISGTQGNRIHLLDVGAGTLRASYRATATGNTAPAPVDDYARSPCLRPSRYAEADKFFGFAATEFGSYAPSAQLLEKVAAWVGAADTLLAGEGGCRDYADNHGGAITLHRSTVSADVDGLLPSEDLDGLVCIT